MSRTNQITIITMIRNNPPMKAPIIISIVSDCEIDFATSVEVSGLSVTSGSFVVNRSVRSKNVVSNPSVQDILIIYSEVELTSILEFSDKVREASLEKGNTKITTETWHTRNHLNYLI
jgi:hypothetical protein